MSRMKRDTTGLEHGIWAAAIAGRSACFLAYPKAPTSLPQGGFE